MAIAVSKAAGETSWNIVSIALGKQLITAWYPSSYPSTFLKDARATERLHVCEFCFKYTPDPAHAIGHSKFCEIAQEGPVGNLVYRKEQYSIYEVDGEQHKLFCQCLCLFSKFFLDNKSIHYDVENFLFYTLTETPLTTTSTSSSSRVVGFFSKEKMSWDDYNLACILVFPPFQRRGLGQTLIAFSYELSKLDDKIGSPEKPLSDLGYKGYMSYWSCTVANKILSSDSKTTLSINAISKATFIHQDDVLGALNTMNALLKRADGKVVIAKQRIREWVRANNISLTPPLVDAESMICRHDHV